MSEELKACPFCGSTRIVKGERYFAMCVDCGATGPERNSDATVKKFMGDWNTRPSAWRPIESAPKDGTAVDVWVNLNGGYRLADVVWRKNEWQAYDIPEFGHSIELCRVEWQHFSTHWQPLPAPPEQGKEGV